MTEDYNIDNDRANARIDFMSHVGIIAQKSITDDQSAIIAQGLSLIHISEPTRP